MIMASREPSRRRWWIWGFAILGALAFLVEGLSLTAGWAFARWWRGDNETAFLADPFYDSRRWCDPEDVVAVMRDVPTEHFETWWKGATIAWCPWRPLERFIIGPESGNPCSGRGILRLRLGFGGWKYVAYHDGGTAVPGESEEARYTHQVPWLLSSW